MKIPELQNIPIQDYFTERQTFLLSKLGLQTLEDLLCCFPFRYEDRTKISSIANAILNQETAMIKAEVVNHEIFFWNKKRCIKVIVQDDSARAELVGFNIKAFDKIMPIGGKFIIYGKFEFRFNVIQITQFEFETVQKFESNQSSLGKIFPVYRLTENLKIKEFHKIIHKAYELFAEKINDPIPKYFLESRKLTSKIETIQQLHFPTDFQQIEKARIRGAYEEFLLTRIGLEIKRRQETTITKSHSYPDDSILEKLETILPFTMTQAQKRVIKEIQTDMTQSSSMHRLVQGDVGSGKTTVALAAMIYAAANGLQAAFLAPTEVLAFQHYKKIQPLTEQLGIACALLTGSFGAKERAPILQNLKEGTLPLIIGTHALFQKEVEFHNLSLVVIDEQHKFGVEQRGMMISKGRNPDILAMTATPIPRTITMALYGDLEVSIIDELPAGRQIIETKKIKKDLYSSMLAKLDHEIKQTRQAFIVCPLIEESENLENVQSVEQIYEAYQHHFPQYKIGLIHGRMTQDKKESIMKEFAENKFELLIATTVIEVGIDIPNATVMVIHNAERFGLAQLHQLRGRVGRGAYKSYCFAVNNGYEADTRLDIFCSTTDGFIIAEEDLKIRGPGDLLGTRQTGIPIFQLANFAKDQKILQTAVKDAQLLINSDPNLDLPPHQLLKKFLELENPLKIFSG